jgi:hypothetical protein
MVWHICNPSFQPDPERRLKQEDGKFEASLGYIVRPYFRKTTTKKSQNVVMHGGSLL